MIGAGRGSVGTAQRQSNQTVRYPAPVNGMDIRKAVSTTDLLSCVYSYNLVPSDYGLRVRQGYREHQTGLSTDEVHTLIPFETASDSDTGDKLFATTHQGIWDVTTAEATPSLVVTFGNQDLDAGYGTYTKYVNQAEDDVLFYADNINGLYSYDSGTNTWTNTGILTGLTEASVKGVTLFKNNVWFSVTDSTVGYYLPILASTGTVAAQYFGDKFRYGGSLAGLFSWTVDGGNGVDDILVAVSTSGDVLVYTGSGPAESDWGLTGSYYIGQIPNTPNFGGEQGGELYLLSVYGLVGMSDLLQGVDTASLQAGTPESSIAFKIAGLIRDDMKDKIDNRGWGIGLLPSEGALLITVPTEEGEAPIQYYYNTGTRGWGFWRDVPMTCFAEHARTVFFGDADGRILSMDVPVDNVLITPAAGVVNGDDIEFSILSAFHAIGSEGMYKRVKLIRPDFLSSQPPAFINQARFDFNIQEGSSFTLNTPSSYGLGFWGTSEWDNAVWGSSEAVSFPSLGGSWGSGRYIAIATKGACRAETRFLGWDVIFDAGGALL